MLTRRLPRVLLAARHAVRSGALALAACGLAVTIGTSRAQQPAQPTAEQFRTVAQKLEDAFNNANQQGALDLFAPTLHKALDTPDLAAFWQELMQDYGRMTTIGTPVVTGSTARIPVSAERGSLTLTMTLDPQNLISGLYVTPAPSTAPAPERNATPLKLPVKGEWYVYWGGPTEAENFHARSQSQRRAIDLVQTDAEGQTHRGFGYHNADYYAYGEDVMAPGDGTIVSVVRGVPENTPGIPNPYVALGNMIVEKIANDTYAVLGHLQSNSITVQPGDTVKAGQVIAKVGNSGNITEPTLHFHLQNGPDLANSTGFAPYFSGLKVVNATGTSTPSDYTPVRGDRISPATLPTSAGS